MNRKLSNRIAKSKKQLGQGMTEYIIIVALVAIGAIAVYSAFGHTVQDQMSAITNSLGGNNQAATTAVQDAAKEGQAATKDAANPLGMDSYTKTNTDQ